MSNDILVNVLSAIIAGALGFMAKQVILPWFSSLFFKGYRLDADWDVYYENNNTASATLTFKQIGNRIKAKSHVHENTKREKVNRVYKYTGKIFDKSIVMDFYDENNKRLFGGAMVFYISDSDCKEMKGTTIYYKPEQNAVVKVDAILRKRI